MGRLFPKGTSANPGGRPKGPNKITLVLKTADEIAAKYKILPLDYLMQVVNDENVGRTVRIDAAKAAAPYVHQKKPMAIEGGDPSKPITLVDLLAVREMDMGELNNLIELLKKAGAALPLADEEA